MKRVTIHSIWSKCLHTDRVFTYSVDVPDGTTVMETLENAFCLTNMDDRPRRKEVPSTTAGDIMLASGQHYLVESCGYRKLNTSEVFHITTKLTSRETAFGYDHMVKEGYLKGVMP
jgi:hypothetical protein